MRAEFLPELSSTLSFSDPSKKVQLLESLLDWTKAGGKNGFMQWLEQKLNHWANQWADLSPGPLTDELRQKARIIAHRGAHKNSEILENTSQSIQTAIDLGLWGVELDLRWTKDHIPIIHHDPDLERVFGRPDLIISNLSWSELHSAEPRVPSLMDAVALGTGKLHLMLELKESAQLHKDRIENLMRALYRLVPGRDFHLMSLQPKWLDEHSWLKSKAKVDIAWFNMGEALKNAQLKQHGGIAGHFVLLNETTRNKAHSLGMQTGTGFIETKGCLIKELTRGIDWIFTDQASRLKAFLN
jgi:glycerophosphoryl diester phosphodiesterase